MKKLFLLLPVLALAACAATSTPQDKYFALTEAVTVVAQAAETYVDVCNAQPKGDPCYAKFPLINSGTKTMLTALRQADKVFVTKDSAYYDLSLTVAQNAANDLKNLLAK